MAKIKPALRRIVLSGGRGEVANTLAKVDALEVIASLARSLRKANDDEWRREYLKERRRQIIVENTQAIA